MIRLEHRDIEDPQRLGKLAAAAGLTSDEFQNRFGYLVGVGQLPAALSG
jgi:hypothetical protein